MVKTENSVRDSFEADRTVIGVATSVGDPTLVEYMGGYDVDLVQVDFEHSYRSPYDGNNLENLARAAGEANTELLVRTPRPEPSMIRKILDAGIRNILVPRVETTEETKRVARAGRFKYDGDTGGRGLAASRAADWGRRFDGYTAREDDSVCIGVMIENTSAVDNLEEILAVPELGFVFIGPYDLSVALGHTLDPAHPDVQESIKYIKKMCQQRDVPVGIPALEAKEIQQKIEAGYDLLVIGNDLLGIGEHIEGRLKQIHARDGLNNKPPDG